MKVDKSNRLTGIGARMLIAVLVVALAACTPIYRNHGYVPSKEELASVQIGDSHEDVANKIGRPSAQGLLNDDGWFYVQSRWKTVGGRAPQEIDRQVLSVTFDKAGKVENIEHFGLERGRVVALSRRVTASSIKGMGFIRQLFSNVGRMSAGQFLGDNGPTR
ncbi:MAG: outer membrane protein assembly factor BamE [Paracoccaceae bacterium]